MAERVPIYVHESKGRYYYDTHVASPSEGWSGGVVSFRAYATAEPGMVPIYRHDPGPVDGYYYDRQPGKKEGFSEGRVAFYAYATQQDGTVPVFQHEAQRDPKPRYYYDTELENHSGWSRGVEVFYAYRAQATLADDIMGVLGRQGAQYSGITYLDTHDNKFTLLDTPQLWDGSPTVTQPIYACERLLDEIQFTISIAQNIVDITLLWQANPNIKQLLWLTGMPLGGFQQAISAGLRGLTQAKRHPLVRIIIGVPTTNPVAEPDLRNWLQATIELNNNQKLADVRFPILIGCHKRSPESWNHAKIVAADSKRAIVGGHNLWASDYLGLHPVHDVSGLIQGSAVGCVQNFCSNLWTSPAKLPHPQMLENGKFRNFTESTTIPPPVKTTETGTRMLSLGRLGFGIADKFSVATNASVSARMMALCRAKNTIRISQQSLYFTVAHLVPGFDFYSLWAIVKAMQAGVNVQIVVSNDVPLSEGGYEGHLKVVIEALASLYVGDRLGIFRPSKNPARDDLADWADAAQESTTKQLPLSTFRHPSQSECDPYLNELNARLRVAPLHYAPDINYWQVGAKQKFAANHAKVYIIDDTHFYVGSDNFYLSATTHGLQEFGHLIEGKTETADFIQKYWDKLWKNSGPRYVKATFSDLKFVVQVPQRPPRR